MEIWDTKRKIQRGEISILVEMNKGINVITREVRKNKRKYHITSYDNISLAKEK